MLKSLKECNCFGRIIISIFSISNKNSVQKRDSKKRPRKLQKNTQIPPDLSPNPNNKIHLQKIDQKHSEETSKFQQKFKKQSKIENLKRSQIKQQVPTQNQNQGNPQTQRSLINRQKSLSVPSESNQNDLPTQKSQIIMNDIGKSVNHNQNIFMNLSKEEDHQKFEKIYEKISFIKSVGIYDVFTVKKRNSNETFKAYIMKDYESLRKLWDLSQQESIERYSQIYEIQKVHIKNLIELQKINCRHLLKLIDYELKPPTIDMTTEQRKFRQGSIAILFENIEETLEEFLQNNDALDKSDKKRIVYQLVTCLREIHENKMVVKDLSLRSFYIDQFQNVKFISMKIQQFSAKMRDTINNLQQAIENNDKERLLYMSPQQLGCNYDINNKQSNLRSSYFHSGFSVISDFDKKQSTQEQQNLWRLGIIIGKVLSGKFIFNNQDKEMQKKQIIETLLTPQRQDQQQLSSLFRQKLKGLSNGQMKIIVSLLKIESNERKSCKQLLESDYLTNILDQSCQ